MNKKNTGITLVALVITIIILLILAGITISQLTGSGLFENAKLAAEKSKDAQEKEEGIFGDYENKIGEYIDGSREDNQNAYDYSILGNEKYIGKWYDGKKMYETSIAITIPTTETTGTYAEATIDLSKYSIDSCTIHDGYFKWGEDNYNNSFLPLVIASSSSNDVMGVMVAYSSNGKLNIINSVKSFSGGQGYITLHYTKTTD